MNSRPGPCSWRATATLLCGALERVEWYINDEENVRQVGPSTSAVTLSRTSANEGSRSHNESATVTVPFATEPASRSVREGCVATPREEVRRLFRPYQPDISHRYHMLCRRSGQSAAKGKGRGKGLPSRDSFDQCHLEKRRPMFML